MSSFNPKDISNIYWASNEGFKAGRDPMGIENSSVATYGCLLPGLTNLTSRIRYYSFFCWLLNEYDLNGKQRFKTHQRNFVRRAELAMAFVLNGRGELAIAGAQFILEGNLNEISRGIYDLAEGADYRTDKTNSYWTFPQGALGQYYIGSMVYLNLLRIEENRFYVRQRGKELAEAFRQSTDATARERFLKTVENGVIKVDDIDLFLHLSIGSISLHSPEWEFLNTILVSPDANGSTFRRDSIYLFIKALCIERVSVKDFPECEYWHSKEKSSPSNAEFGWYFFYLCEVLHYSVETILWFILEMAERHNLMPIPAFMHLCEETIASYMPTNMKNVEDCVQDNDGIISDLLETLKETVRSGNFSEAAGQAVWLLLRLYNDAVSNLTDIEKFEKENDLYRQFGIFSVFIKNYVGKHLSLPISLYVGKILRQVMNDHTMSACRKMGQNLSDLRKFLIEDGCIVHVETRFPQFTNPRTKSLYSFLRDMQYIDENNCMTPVSIQFIEDYEKERA